MRYPSLTRKERLNMWFWWAACGLFTAVFWIVVVTGVAWLLS